MRYLIIVLCAAALAACMNEKLPVAPADVPPPNPDYGPVDGKYLLALSSLRVLCTPKDGSDVIDQRFPDQVIEVDAYRHPDEPVLDLLHRQTNKFAGALDGGVKNVRRHEAIVAYDLETATQFSKQRVIMDGTITPSEMVLDYEERYSDDRLDCVYTGHAEGRARPFADAAAIDGLYVADIRSWGIQCPHGREGEPVEAGSGTFDVKDFGDGQMRLSGDLRLSFGGGSIEFDALKPGEDGAFTFHGDIDAIQREILGGSYPTTMHGEAHGTLRPDRAEIDLLIEHPEHGEGCGMEAEFNGAKLVAERGAVPNEYRMKYRISDSCFGTTEEEYGTSMLVETGAGAYQLTDPGGVMAVMAKDGRLHGEIGDLDADGVHVVLEGSASPPRLEYVYTIEQIDPFYAEPCVLTVEAAGEVRYVFD